MQEGARGRSSSQVVYSSTEYGQRVLRVTERSANEEWGDRGSREAVEEETFFSLCYSHRRACPLADGFPKSRTPSLF